MDSTKEEDMDSDTQPLMRPSSTRRKSSMSETLNKFTPQHFHRRRTTTDLTSSASTVNLLPPSRLPTPAGISRSSSFFSSLSAFNSKPPSVPEKGKPAQSVTVKRTRKLSDRLTSTSFFASAPACRGKAPTPYPGHRNREHSVQIPQHGLMKPIRPGVPRSSTVGNLSQQTSSPRTPSFMRPTSSSAARRQSQSSGLGLSSGNRAPRPAPRSAMAQTVSEIFHERELERESKQQSKKPANPHDDSFLLSPTKEEDEEKIDYATDEEIEIGTAQPMTISPIRSASSHNPYSNNNFAYGLPNKNDKSKRDSSKPFDHSVARPVSFEPNLARREGKPLPALTPDRTQAQRYDLGHSQEISQLTERDSTEYYRRHNSQSLLRSASDYPLGEDYKPEDVHFANEIGDDEFDEEDTVIHTVEGELIKGSFASVSTSEAASEANDLAHDEGDNDNTTSTITGPREDNPQAVSNLCSLC